MKCKSLEQICYECIMFQDDTYIDDNGKMVSNCKDCWVTREEVEGDD